MDLMSNVHEIKLIITVLHNGIDKEKIGNDFHLLSLPQFKLSAG